MSVPVLLQGGAARNYGYVWDIALLDWVPMQQPILNAGSVTIGGMVAVSNMIPAVETGLAKEAGNLAALVAKDYATQATLALIKAKTDMLDVALSTRTKPADQQHVIVDSLVSVDATSLPLPTNASQETGGNLDAMKTDLDSIKNSVTGLSNLTNGLQKTKIIDTGGATVAVVKNGNTTPVNSDTAIVVGFRPIDAGTLGNVLAASLALETGGNLDAIKAKTDNLDVALSTLTKPGDQQHVIVDSSATVAVTSAGLTNLDVALSTRLKPADTLAAVTAITNPVSTKTDLTPSAPTSASVGVASAQAVAASATRKGLVLTNVSNARISLGLGSPAVLDDGITLYPGGTFEMDEFLFDLGAVNAIASAAASKLGIQELTT